MMTEPQNATAGERHASGDLTLRNISKNFGDLSVIRDVSLHIDNGAFVVFVGPSGCGKSTMLRMIAGLESISSGALEIGGQLVNDLPPVKRGIAMVFQSYALYPHMSVYENIAFPLRVARLDREEVERRVRGAAGILHLEERLFHKPGQLSGGQRQRVAIGRSIVRAPRVFLFDEPLSNLDAALRAGMRIELTRLHQRLGNTMIYVTHDQVEAMTMADTIVVLNNGVIAQAGSPLELYHMPRNMFVAGFIGNPKMNFLPATCKAARSEAVVLRLPNDVEVEIGLAGDGVSEGEALTLGVRPDALGTGGSHMRLQVEVVERLGNVTVLYGTAERIGQLCVVTDGDARARVGENIGIDLVAADCHVFRADGTALDRRIDLSGFTGPPAPAPALPAAFPD